jgi:hypothetical protein
MGHMAGTTFGIGAPATFPAPAISWGVSPYAGQALGAQPFPSQPYLQPFSNQSIAGQGIGAGQLPQILQFLQIVPQQLQQLQVLQQQQLLQLQQILQVVPAQLQQLQQLIQVVPQQVQFLQQQQPFGSAISGGFGLVPQAFAGQGASYVM